MTRCFRGSDPSSKKIDSPSPDIVVPMSSLLIATFEGPTFFLFAHDRPFPPFPTSRLLSEVFRFLYFALDHPFLIVCFSMTLPCNLTF